MAIITFNQQPVQTIGNLPAIGSQAPNFTVTKTDLSEISLKNYLGQTILLNIFPSLDTSTCAAAMKRYNEIAAEFPDILILCVSADLPFAQKRFCGTEHLDNIIPVSVFRHPSMGDDYGVTITEGPLTGLLSRAVVIVDDNGKVIYTQQVSELTKEANYAAIVEALRQRVKIHE